MLLSLLIVLMLLTFVVLTLMLLSTFTHSFLPISGLHNSYTLNSTVFSLKW